MCNCGSPSYEAQVISAIQRQANKTASFAVGLVSAYADIVRFSDSQGIKATITAATILKARRTVAREQSGKAQGHQASAHELRERERNSRGALVNA